MIIQSNGMGTQSVAMYYMSSMGKLPRFDYSIFVDTGAEKPETYRAMEYMKKWAKANNGVPLIVLTGKNIATDLSKKQNSTKHRFSSIPGFTVNPFTGEVGKLRRQCTSEYKINQIQAKVKELQGKGKTDRYDAFQNFIGISIDEVTRISYAMIAKETKVFEIKWRKINES